MTIDFGREDGATLIETAVACGILVIVTTGLLGMTTTTTTITENQGHLGARVAEYAVDKMEQLLELTYGDAQSDTTLFPSVDLGGKGLAIGGSTNPAAPVVGYSDYLRADGSVLCTVATPCNGAAPANWYYMRTWQVTQASPNLKQITVTATVARGANGAMKSIATISAFKTDCPSGC